MSLLPRWFDIVLSVLSGIILGVEVGLYGPFLLALMLGADPIHQGHYGDWILVLIFVMPVIVGASLAASAWFGRWRGARRTAQWLALIVGCWELFLMVRYWMVL